MDTTHTIGTLITDGPIDCACVIHGDTYSWVYVDRLYNMLKRHISRDIRLHVYTEADRPVPSPMIKHGLTPWHIAGPKCGWWYKMQLFNNQHHAGPLLYFDLDVVIVRNIDWIWQLPLQHFWSVRDFKYLWRPTNYHVNSSIMWWDTNKFAQVYQNFARKKLETVMRTYHGDQDYINEYITFEQRKFLDINRIKSWRWQALEGGYDFAKKVYRTPGTGTTLTDRVSVLVFHGKPKPDQIFDPIIVHHWQ